MGNISLVPHEHEVERSRAKLTQDLAILCSPKTLAAFTDDLKQEAFETRDAFWEKIKARAASNPAAVIAIGAGLAWRLLRSPPIASALIGVGLFSLWKTQPRTAYDASGRRTRLYGTKQGGSQGTGWSGVLSGRRHCRQSSGSRGG